MLDLHLLKRMRLSPRPRFQRVVALTLLMPNYRIPPRVDIRIEGELPPGPVFFAMNHTDRYNYWPFQYQLWREFGRFTATWVKGKYYGNPVLSRFMELTNNIPTVSRGYLITRDALDTLGRKPTAEEYRALKALLADPDAAPTEGIPDAILNTPRDLLGLPFDPEQEPWAYAIDRLFTAMVERFNALNAEAFGKGLDVIVFPQGTRSIRLSRGHIGLAQMALHLKKTIVPVGCNGSDKVYPSSSPLARGGHRITYRVGAPITYEDMAPFHIDEPYRPVLDQHPEHLERFQGLTSLVMDRINDLLDPPYQYSEDLAPEGVDGAGKLV